MRVDLLAVASFVVAAAALGATFYQARLTRTHNRLSVRPKLDWDRGYSSSSQGTEVTFALTNKGLGPAVIKERFLAVAGNRFTPAEPATDDEVAQFISVAVPPDVRRIVNHCGLPGIGTAMTAGERLVIAQIFFPGMDRAAVEVIVRHLEVSFSIEYESIYGDRFSCRW